MVASADTGIRPRVELVEEWIEISGLRCLVRRSPEGEKTGLPVIHVHGFGISGRYLLPTAELLAVAHETYVPDLPGFGRSQRPRPDLDIGGLAHALVEFMDVVGVPRAVFVGNSLGCIVICELAAAYPERIERAVLCSPAGGPNNRPLPRALWQLLVDGFREPLAMTWLATTDYVRFGLIPALRLFRAMIRYPTVERFLALPIPTLAVLGGRDPLVRPERFVEAAAQGPKLTVVVVSGAPHAINFTHPEELANVIESFLVGDVLTDDPTAVGDVEVLVDERDG